MPLARYPASGLHVSRFYASLVLLLSLASAGCVSYLEPPSVAPVEAVYTPSSAPETPASPAPATLVPALPPSATLTAPAPAVDGSDGLSLTILHTNDVSGWTEASG